MPFSRTPCPGCAGPATWTTRPANAPGWRQWHATLDRSLPTRRVRALRPRPGGQRGEQRRVGAVPDPRRSARAAGVRASTVYYLHGGGYVAPIDAYHVRYALRLAALLDAEVVLPDYPLAPEHTWRDSHRALVDDLAARTRDPGPGRRRR